MRDEPVDTSSRKRLGADQRREQILCSARRVFVAHGFRGARTKDIAAEAGVNEALLYRHFASKDELFEAAVVAPLELAVARLVAASGQPPIQIDVTGEVMFAGTRQFIEDLYDVMEEVAPLLGVMLFGDAEAAAVHFRERIGLFIDRVVEVVFINLTSWTHRPFDAHALVRAVFGSVWFEATAARLMQTPLRKRQLADELAATIIYGLASREQPVHGNADGQV